VSVRVEHMKAVLIGIRGTLFGAMKSIDAVISALGGGWLPTRRPLPRRDVFERDGWRCSYCDVEITMTTGHADHVVPRSRGGSDDPSNLVAACARCNLSKGARTPDEWRGEVSH
jgi:hypothetical protein